MNFKKPGDSCSNESSIKWCLKNHGLEIEIGINANATKWSAASPKSCQTNLTERGNSIY